MESSHSYTEGKIQFVLENFGQLAEVAYSKCITIENTSWRLMIVKKDAVTNSQGTKASKYLGAFVQCVTKSPPLPQDWKMPVLATVKLLNHNSPDKSFSKDFEHKFSATSVDWGFSAFMKLKDVVDPVKGFLKDDSLEFHAKLSILSERKEKSYSHAPTATTTTTTTTVLMAGMSCPLCNNPFHTQGNKQPMILKCGHTFCLDCLQKSHSKSADSKKSVHCTMCDVNHVSLMDESLWSPNFSMIQLIGNVIPKSKHFCTTHQHDKNYFCFTDQTLVCIYCAYHGEHRTHDCKHMDEAREQVEISLKEVKRKVSSKAAELERQVQLLSDEQKLLKTQENHVTKVVNDFYSQIEAVLHRQKEMMLKELNMHTNDLSSSVDEKMSSIQKQCHDVQQGLSQFTSWQSLPSQEALGSVSALKSQLLSVVSKADMAPSSAQPGEPLPSISVQLPNLEVFNTLGNLGKLTFVRTGDQLEVTNDCSSNTDRSQVDHSQSILNGSVEEGDLPPAKRRKSAAYS